MSASHEQTVGQALEAAGKLRPDVVAGRVDGVVLDLLTAVPVGAVKVEAIASDHADALAVIRHSSSHIMADAVQRLFPGTKVAFGPATENGFYYDYARPSGKFDDDDLRAIEKKMAEIIAEDLPFVREAIAGDDARKLLSDLGETFKLEHLERLLAQGAEISLYRHGDWVDLCEGPHVPRTKFLKAFQLTSVAGAYWRGDERNPMLQRIYGTAFANAKVLKKHLKQLEEAKKRDHRKLGKELDLIAFDPLAPASPFFLPRGARVYNDLIDYVRGLYGRYGYEEVITPQIFDKKLFETSGHLPAYAENMYLGVTVEDLEGAAKALEKQENLTAESAIAQVRKSIRYGVKPMNCPAHCQVFSFRKRSYRDLPWRVADFGRLHRYERSGVTQGLTRVRTFSQDDAHIFCTMDQVQSEIGQFLDLVHEVYRDFGFTDVRIVLATRPDERLGTDEVWDKSEAALEEGIKDKGLPYEIAEGEGAFYGPKIEFHLKDALGRPWQLGTMQADFNLPERFDLSYVGKDNTAHRPVMLHRAILGSVERFYGVLIEHVGGAFPTWIAPEQVTLLTISEKFNDFALEAKAELEAAGIRVITDLTDDKLGAKVRRGRLMRIPYLGVIGEKEVEARGLAVRSRDENKDIGLMPLTDFIARVRAESLPPSQRKA